MKNLLSKDYLYLTLILLVAVAFISPMFFFGIPDGDKDFPQHLQFASAYHDAISSGNFLPVWGSSENYGFGSVGVRFYPPISSFSLGLIKLLTENWFDAIWLSFLFWMIAGCFGVYFWAKEWLPPKYAVIAAALYVIIPYHLLQIYQMWLYAEFVAAAILPFCFLFITRICRYGRLNDVFLFSISYSLLILSHIPTTITGSLSLAFYAFLLMEWSQYKKTFIKLFAALIVSLSATAFYWIKIITELDWVKVANAQYSSGTYDPQRNLFPLFLSAGKDYVGRSLWHFDVSFGLTVLLFLSAIIYLGTQIKKFERKERQKIYALSLTGFFALFMMTLPSFFIWQSISILQKIQFPWRWLAILSVISVLTFAVAFQLLLSHHNLIKKLLGYPLLLLCLSIILFDITQNIIQSAPIPRAEFETKLPELLNEPACDCWQTTWAKNEAYDRREKVFAELRRLNITLWKPTQREFTVEEGEPTKIRVATFYYPYWKAKVNDQLVQVEMDKDGSILIPVETGISSVELYFQEPLFVKYALALSFLIWILLFAALILSYRNRKSGFLHYK